VATDVKLPRLGQGMESGTIVRWLKSVGEPVRKADPLYELDTDKVTQEVEAEVDGVLLEIRVESGDVEVGATIAVIGETGETAAPAGPEAPNAVAPPEPGPGAAEAESAKPVAASTEPTAAAPPTAHATSPPTATVAASSAARVKASPLARRIARERGIELSTVAGTGPEGRVLAEDVERTASGEAAPVTGPDVAPSVAPPSLPPTPGEVEVVPLTTIRRTIARRLTEAWTAPVFQLGVAADMTEATALRETLVAATAEGDVKPTVNDLLVKFAAVALVRHPHVNATYTGDEIHRHPSAHVGIAVAAPHGLVVPVVADADRRTVREIARSRADLVTRARDNKLKLEDLEGGTFTISNLGMFGVEQFTAVLNPPQVAILAVGTVKEEVVVVEGEIEIAPLLRLTLTCDHRAIDGADGARFLQTLVALIEQPALAL
jgi:pyruvate dehydrogenase E2 component (dihydrolipoamide acetyltransferase)